jgi:hypothetical protein
MMRISGLAVADEDARVQNDQAGQCWPTSRKKFGTEDAGQFSGCLIDSPTTHFATVHRAYQRGQAIYRPRFLARRRCRGFRDCVAASSCWHFASVPLHMVCCRKFRCAVLGRCVAPRCGAFGAARPMHQIEAIS